MGNNYHTLPVTTTAWSLADFSAFLAELDRAITYHKLAIVHCDGRIHYNKATGVLTWTDTLRIHFNRADGLAIQNTVAAGNITLADNEFVYVDLSETNDAALSAAKGAITTGAASNFKAYNRLVLGYRNTASDAFFPVYLKNVEESIVTLASGANVTIDWSKGHKQQITLGHDVAFTHSGGVDGETYILYIRQDPASARTPTWVNTIYGAEITEVTISATLSSENILGFIYRTGIGYCLVSNVSGYVAP